MLVELGDKGFLSLPVSILVCAKDSPSSFNQCSPPGADLAWVDLEPASYLCCGLLTFECLKGYLSLKGGAVLLATLLLLLLLRAYFVILGAGTDLSYLSEILGPSHSTTYSVVSFRRVSGLFQEGTGLATAHTVKDYYQILGVPRYTTAEGIRRAYLLNARQHHPDLHPDDADAETRMQAINEAYSTLSNPDSRDEYDTGSGTVLIPISPSGMYSPKTHQSGHARPVRRETGILETTTSAVGRLFRYLTT